MGSKVLTPQELKSLTDQAQIAKVQKEFDRAKKEEEEAAQLREAFATRDLHPEVMDRVNAAVKRAAQQGLREIRVLTFPASYCNDHGRRINNAEPDWPDSLEGFAKRAHEFFGKELKPLGFKARTQILNYPDGKPGEVGYFLSW
jgi:hypothetical protein